LGDKPNGPTLGAREAAEPTSPPTARRQTKKCSTQWKLNFG